MTGDFSLLQPIPPLPVEARQALPIFALHLPVSLLLQVDPFLKTLRSGQSFFGDTAQGEELAQEMDLPVVDHLQLGILDYLEIIFTLI